MVWPGSLSDFFCTRYHHHGGRDGWGSLSVRSDKLGSGLLGAVGRVYPLAYPFPGIGRRCVPRRRQNLLALL
jgi:hypothetical protein